MDSKRSDHDTLLSIIDECSDARDVKQQLLSRHPFAREITQKTIVPENLTIAQLETAICTAVYLNENTNALIEEFVWKIGDDEKEFEKYFEIIEISYLRNWSDYEIYIENDEILKNLSEDTKEVIRTEKPKFLCSLKLEKKSQNLIVQNELALRYKGVMFPEKVSMRFSDFVLLSFCAAVGNLRLMRYTYVRGSAWNESTCEYTASNGHLDCLNFAHTYGCKWNERTCSAAARYGHLECLRYAHMHGCR